MRKTESGKVRCAICGRLVEKGDAYQCLVCGRMFCNECMIDSTTVCPDDKF